MKDKFREHFPLPQARIDEIWANSIIVLDTNVLLRMYRFKEDTVNHIFSVLEKYKDRIWLPNQVAWEYNVGRLGKIDESQDIYIKIVEKYKKTLEETEEAIRKLSRLGLHPAAPIENEINNMVSAARESLRDIEEKYASVSVIKYYDDLHERIGEFFTGRVEPDCSQADMDEWMQQASGKYAEGIGPGWTDFAEKKKRGLPERNQFGDFIIWKEMIIKSKKESKNLIFITEDTKQDWWLERRGRTIGAMPYLRKEFHGSSGFDIHFYRLDRFVEVASQKQQLVPSPAAAEDIKNISKLANIIVDFYDPKSGLIRERSVSNKDQNFDKDMNSGKFNITIDPESERNMREIEKIYHVVKLKESFETLGVELLKSVVDFNREEAINKDDLDKFAVGTPEWRAKYMLWEAGRADFVNKRRFLLRQIRRVIAELAAMGERDPRREEKLAEWESASSEPNLL